LSYILRGQFKTHQEYLDFWYAELIDKIGMHSMVIEADMAGNYVALLTVGQRHAIGQNLDCCTCTKETGMGSRLEESWVKYVATPTATSEGAYGAQFC
jgi:hypothetical protein